MITRQVGAAAALGLLIATGGCQSHQHVASSPLSSAPVAAASASPSPSAPASTGAQDLIVSADIRLQLRTAAAELNHLKASDYTGLVPGTTYYAIDNATGTYWAGAGLVPSSSSEPAQVSTQDDGGYYLFRKTGTSAWQVWTVGLTDTEVGGRCPITVPADILAVWHWKPGTCRAPYSQ